MVGQLTAADPVRRFLHNNFCKYDAGLTGHLSVNVTPKLREGRGVFHGDDFRVNILSWFHRPRWVNTELMDGYIIVMPSILYENYINF